MGYPLNIEALGVSGIAVALLLYWNHTIRQENKALRAEVKESREYEREQARLKEQMHIDMVETLKSLEVSLLRDSGP
jgi:hypothetical protein